MNSPKSLPHTDEGVAAALHGVANRQCTGHVWDGANTVLNEEMIAAFTKHAGAFWLENAPESFGVHAGEKLFRLIAKLRDLEKQQPAAS